MGVPSATSAGSQMWVRGPIAQQAASARTAPAAPSRPAARTALPRPPTPAGRAPSASRGHQVAWVTAHGGSGASTLARVLGGADIGSRWPDPARGEPGRVLLVARTHNAGMRAASQALNALRKGEHPAGVQLLAVVLVADAPGRLPRPLGRRVRVLRSAAEVHRVPWIPAWRLGEEADQLPRAVRALARSIAAPAGHPGRPR
ncbi:DUF6668 family protein [Streptomyces sp. HUAS ZL42]|uniref:DUF6668 family protein n=1 Tax=Streptomyces sp. HUAS ZL42 TaxID=3231715 RepID=UPI00345F0650